MPDTPPAERGSPRADTHKGGSVFTKQMGPLPVWGWAGVAVAAVFLWRIMSSRGKSNQAQGQAAGTTSLPYVPGGGVGGVFMIPQSTAPAPTGAAPAGTDYTTMLQKLNANQFTEIQNQTALNTNEADILNKLGGLAPGNAFYAGSQQFQSFNPAIQNRDPTTQPPGGAPTVKGGKTVYLGNTAALKKAAGKK